MLKYCLFGLKKFQEIAQSPLPEIRALSLLWLMITNYIGCIEEAILWILKIQHNELVTLIMLGIPVDIILSKWAKHNCVDKQIDIMSENLRDKSCRIAIVSILLFYVSILAYAAIVIKSPYAYIPDIQW